MSNDKSKDRKYVRYDVTGVDTRGKRFKITTTCARHAAGINLYNGSKWGVTDDGKRHLLARVYN